jgi:transcriptional regulator with XRE-family HTH domain
MSPEKKYDEMLLKAHRRHLGLYRRLADKLGIDASYVSRVAAGKRSGPKILLAILDELRKIQRQLR